MSSVSDLFPSVSESNFKRYSFHSKTDHNDENDNENDDDDRIHAVSDRCESIVSRSSSFHSSTSRSRQSSPSHSPRLGPSRLSSFHRSHSSSSSSSSWTFGLTAWGFMRSCKLQSKQPKGKVKAGKSWYRRKRVKGLLLLVVLLASFFLVNWIMLARLQDEAVHPLAELSENSSAASVSVSVQVRA